MNPPPIPIAAYSAVSAAIVAFIALWVNCFVTLKNQKDTHFYEALKRFGDKDSEVLRASAAGLLAQMGSERDWLRARRPYWEIAFNQLLVGTRIERNDVVLSSVISSLKALVRYRRRVAFENIFSVHIDLQKDLVDKLARHYASMTYGLGDETPGDNREDVWSDWLSEAASVTHLKSQELPRLTRAFPDVFKHSHRDATQFYRAIHDDHLASAKIDAINALADAACRLRWNRNLLEDTIKHFAGKDLDLKSAFLPRANFAKQNLQGVDFSCALVDGSRFDGADLSRAKFSNASLSGCSFQSANLQSTDLTSAVLQDADLQAADLSGAKIVDATLKNADMTDALLDRIHVAGTHWWEATCSDAPSHGKPGNEKRVWSALYHASGKCLPHEAARLNSSVKAFVETMRSEGSVKAETKPGVKEG
ncbi:hypothetical protein CCAX7_15200 [Capsulimonas corticalis]|uniref:Uncharacterized protein n=1 Tax=Capsulimonas corticalis TaxID=2219043 RepID=A0A402CZB6_9BACT|nr:pentapeptide repeat-containing protein [Capsulimonas corticalis]BDI29469.1 hypothetical protein CCAX7_15200 [Capsulimonas corticalis]